MLRMGVGLFVSVAVARYLGPNDFGLYNYVLSIVALVAVIGNLGLQNLARRELVAEPERRDTILGTCFVLSAIAGFIFYVAMLVVVGLITDSSLLLGLFALLGSTLLFNPFKSIEIWFQSQVRSELSVSASSITLLVFAGLKIAAICFGADLLQFSYLFLFECLTLTALLVYYYGRHFGSIRAWQLEWVSAVDFLKQCWPLILSGLAIVVYMRIDQVMLGAMLGEAAVGQYSVAVRISSFWYFIPMILASSLFPAIMKARENSAAHYEQRLQNYFCLNAGLAYAICLPVSVAAPWIVAIMFGPDYTAAAPILAIHAWSSLFVFLGVARGQYLVAEKMFKFSMCCNIAGAAVNVWLNYLLIPIWNGAGAAVASVCSQAIAAFLSSFLWEGARKIGSIQFRSINPVFCLKTIIQSLLKS